MALTCGLELQDNLCGLRQALGVDLGADAGHDQRCLVAIAQPHHLPPCLSSSVLQQASTEALLHHSKVHERGTKETIQQMMERVAVQQQLEMHSFSSGLGGCAAATAVRTPFTGPLRKRCH